MSRSNFPLLVLLAGAVAMATTGCDSSQRPSPGGTAAVANAIAAEPEPKSRASACAMVSQAEMSRILGGAVLAQDNDHSNGKTECIYTAANGISPYAELSVEWGSGEGALMGVGMLGQVEPGIANPYEGIGDQAVAVGPALMIRTGEDLVTIVFSGVDDIPSKAKQILETAKARM